MEDRRGKSWQRRQGRRILAGKKLCFFICCSWKGFAEHALFQHFLTSYSCACSCSITWQLPNKVSLQLFFTTGQLYWSQQIGWAAQILFIITVSNLTFFRVFTVYIKLIPKCEGQDLNKLSVQKCHSQFHQWLCKTLIRTLLHCQSRWCCQLSDPNFVYNFWRSVLWGNVWACTHLPTHGNIELQWHLETVTFSKWHFVCGQTHT